MEGSVCAVPHCTVRIVLHCTMCGALLCYVPCSAMCCAVLGNAPFCAVLHCATGAVLH